MITMMDEIFDRNYQAGRAEFHAGLDRGFARLGKAFGASFDALHRVQWSAPWAHDPRHVGQA
jgi:hypothetical protein